LLIHLEECCPFELIKHLDQSCDLEFEFAQDILGLRDGAIELIISQFGEIYETFKANIHSFEDFLISSVEIKTVGRLAAFLQWKNSCHLMLKDLECESLEKQVKDDFEKITRNLRKALFNFVKENIKEIQEMNLIQDISNLFGEDLGAETTMFSMTENRKHLEQNGQIPEKV